MSRVARIPLLPLLGLALALGLPLGEAALAIPAAEAGLLFLAPVLLLGAILASGRYPGERALIVAAARWSDRRRRRVAAAPPPVGPRVPFRVLRGTLVLAHHVAVRPPPASLPFAA